MTTQNEVDAVDKVLWEYFWDTMNQTTEQRTKGKTAITKLIEKAALEELEGLLISKPHDRDPTVNVPDYPEIWARINNRLTHFRQLQSNNEEVK